MTVVDSLAREVGSVGVLLHKLRDDDWAAPTRCAPMTVKELVAHVARGAARIREMLAQEPLDTQPQKDAITYFQYDPQAEAPSILARAQSAAAELTTTQLVQRWDEDWVHALNGAREALATGDPVLPTIF